MENEKRGIPFSWVQDLDPPSRKEPKFNCLFLKLSKLALDIFSAIHLRKIIEILGGKIVPRKFEKTGNPFFCSSVYFFVKFIFSFSRKPVLQYFNSERKRFYYKLEFPTYFSWIIRSRLQSN